MHGELREHSAVSIFVAKPLTETFVTVWANLEAVRCHVSRRRRPRGYRVGRSGGVGRGLGVGLHLPSHGVGIGVTVGVAVAVAVGVGVGVGAPDCAQYLPPVLK